MYNILSVQQIHFILNLAVLLGALPKRIFSFTCIRTITGPKFESKLSVLHAVLPVQNDNDMNIKTYRTMEQSILSHILYATEYKPECQLKKVAELLKFKNLERINLTSNEKFAFSLHVTI